MDTIMKNIYFNVKTLFFYVYIFLLYRISSHAYSLLEKEGLYPSGLILEAPFTKMSDEIREYPLTKVNY